MSVGQTETTAPEAAEIIDRGRGPEIRGTRITVYAILDFLLVGWSPERIASWFQVTPRQVEAAIEHIGEHKIEVLANYIKILERCERGNPPELQAKLDANHVKFQELVQQVRSVRAQADADIHELIQKHRTPQNQENAHGGSHGRQ